VVVVLEENQSYSAVIGSASMPYLNSLASQNGLATQYYANTHPSIGNYFILTAGQIVTNNDGFSSTINVDNIVRHLLTAGQTWKSYAESLPYTGYTGGDKYPYVRHHNPFSYFSDVVNSGVEKLNLVPFSHFASDLANNQLPNYSFVVPNQNHNAHDCPTGPTGCTNAQKLATADAWLKTNIAPLLSNAAFQQDGILIIVFDEGFSTDTAHGGGHVAAVVVGPKVRKGFKSTAFYQHQSLLRTSLDALNVSSYPGLAASAVDMADLFTSSSATKCAAATYGVTVCSPAAGSTVGSPVHFAAAAKSTNPITAMRIYIDSVSQFLGYASSLDTYLSVKSGTHSVVVQAWDSTGAVFKSSLTIQVP
jgi:phosphatidylinositol-3-phosphatase